MSTAYTTRELKKWDVYYIEKIDEYGGRVGRPAIIVSPDIRNQGGSYYISGIFLTTSPQNGIWYPVITSTGRKSFAVCSEVNTIRREHIGSFLCSLTSSEIEGVKQGMASYFELTDDTDALHKIEQKNESLLQKIASLEEKLRESAAVLEKKELDRKVYELAYDRVMDRLVEKQIEFDYLKRLAQAPVVEEKPVVVEPDPEPVVEAPVVEEKVNINTCTEQEIMKLGVSFSVARNISAARPFLKMDDLSIVPGLTRIGYQLLCAKVTLGDVSAYAKPKKKPVKVAEPEPEIVEAAEDKVNINTASATELHDKLGLSLTVCYSITGVRKRNGQYKSIEELKDVPRFTAGHWALYEDKVCI